MAVDFSDLKNRFGYVVRYAVLPSRSIVNMQSPDTKVVAQYDEEGKLIETNSVQARFRRRNSLDGFYTKLEADILENGVENPLLVYAGKVYDYLEKKLPEDLKEDRSKIVACVHGGSRLWFAHKYNLDVPCVIVDWIDKFKDAKLIETEEDFLSLYKSPPTTYKVFEKGLVYLWLPPHHLER